MSSISHTESLAHPNLSYIVSIRFAHQSKYWCFQIFCLLWILVVRWRW